MINKFDICDFKSPPSEYTPIYGWLWTGTVSKEKTLAQINKMRDFDIKSKVKNFLIVSGLKAFAAVSKGFLCVMDISFP